MICPAPCRQRIRGANKICVHGVWKHKRCPRTVWQTEEIERAKNEATRLAEKLKMVIAIPSKPSFWRTIWADLRAKANALKTKPRRKKK